MNKGKHKERTASLREKKGSFAEKEAALLIESLPSYFTPTTHESGQRL